MNYSSSTGPTPQDQSGEWKQLKEKVSRQRNLIPSSFALVVVFFFFGFCHFKCNGTKVASLKGINLVTGTHLKTSVNSAFNTLDAFEGGRGKSKGERIPPNLWAIVAFVSAITGVAVFYQRKKKEAFWGAVLGGTGFIALIILRLVIRSAVENQSGSLVAVETSFLFGYWASVLAFLIAGGVSYLRLTTEKLPAVPGSPGDHKPAPTPIHIRVTTQHGSDKEA